MQRQKKQNKSRQRQETMASQYGIELREKCLPPELRLTTLRLYRQIRRLLVDDALVWGGYVLEYIVPEHAEEIDLPEDAPGPGYPFYILYHRIVRTDKDWCCIAPIRANNLNPHEIRRQLTPVQQKIAICLAYMGVDPDCAQHIFGGAITDPTKKMLRVRHLF
jgi:hypothetical protein